jgi:hypothetical protein
MKPCAKCQGVGIFMISKLSQIKKWSAKNGEVAPAPLKTLNPKP